MRVLHLLCLLLMLSGCASAGRSTFSVAPPLTTTIENEAYVDVPFEECWANLVENLSKSFFVINNIEKESRIINVSFHTDQPEDFIDCGTTTRTYKKGQTDETYRYRVAEDSVFKSGWKTGMNQAAIATYSRTTALDGRINIFIAPDGDRTKVSVNTRYIFSVDMSGSYVLVGGALEIVQGRGPIASTTTEFSFSTNDSQRKNIGTDDSGNPVYMQCFPTGELELSILQMAH